MARNGGMAGNGKGRNNTNWGFHEAGKGTARGGNSQVAYVFPSSKHDPTMGTDVFFSTRLIGSNWFEVWWTPQEISQWHRTRRNDWVQMGWSNWDSVDGFSGDAWGHAGCNYRQAHGIGKGRATGRGNGGKGKGNTGGKGKGGPVPGASGMRHQHVFAFQSSNNPKDGTDVFFSWRFEPEQTWYELWWTPAVIRKWWASASSWTRMGHVLWTVTDGFSNNRISGLLGMEVRRHRKERATHRGE